VIILKERNLQLEILKIMACFAVVILHVTGIITFRMEAGYQISHTLYYAAGFAVPIFFMVNGFLMLNKEKVTYAYIIKKVLNILLVVFAWNIILFLIVLKSSGRVINPFGATLNSLIQRNYFWQFWFFGALIIMYAVLPILHKLYTNNKYAVVITGIFIVFCLVVDGLSIFRSINRKAILQVQVIQTYRLWTWFAYYLLGGLLGKRKIREYILNKITKRVNLLIFMISLLIISVYQYNMAHNYYRVISVEFFYDNIFTFIWNISLFLLIYRTNIKNSTSISRFIGLISDKIMGVYIVHVTVINFATHFYRFDTQITNTIFIFVVAVISLILTLIISKIPVANRLIKV
jgi:surface polysaccharide O-acyltransferase-like enzyme